MWARRNITALLAAVLALSAPVGCSGEPARPHEPGGTSGPRHDRDSPQKGPAAPGNPDKVRQAVRLIGDGSTSDTGPQPHQPKTETLEPGEKPPQFVVFSWDGAGQNEQKLFSRFRAVGEKYGATMTYFLSGVHLLPAEKRYLYDPPRHRRGASSIGFNDVKGIKATVEQLRGGWLDGHEIGTHFNGHFCGRRRGVGSWSARQWASEIQQARSFVENWKTNSGLAKEKPLPFDYGKELVGGRAPCLKGQKNLIRAVAKLGWRYDASSPGGLQVWPRKVHGLWDFPLQQIPVPGHSFETLSMDYGFFANKPRKKKGKRPKRSTWGRQMREGLLAAFDRAYEGNRAPLFVGNHFESWNGGTYMRAVEDVIKEVCPRKGVRCVSFKQLADWLDAQNPFVLEKLRALDVGMPPPGGWKHYSVAEPTFPRKYTSERKRAPEGKRGSERTRGSAGTRGTEGKHASEPEHASEGRHTRERKRTSDRGPVHERTSNAHAYG